MPMPFLLFSLAPYHVFDHYPTPEKSNMVLIFQLIEAPGTGVTKASKLMTLTTLKCKEENEEIRYKCLH